MPPSLKRVLHVLRCVAALAALGVSACATSAPEAPAPDVPAPDTPVVDASNPGLQARIVEGSGPLQCVAYARSIGAVEIYGDAWTWWEQAAGAYERGSTPSVGAVLVLQKHRKSLGHVAVVTGVLGDRLILIEHANWLNRYEIHKDTPVLDVSPEGDWSVVRVWYTPGATWGAGVYPVYGFIYPVRMAALP